MVHLTIAFAASGMISAIGFIVSYILIRNDPRSIMYEKENRRDGTNKCTALMVIFNISLVLTILFSMVATVLGLIVTFLL